jgi:hypothetical protein
MAKHMCKPEIIVKEECEVAILDGGRKPFKVLITATVSQNGQSVVS